MPLRTLIVDDEPLARRGLALRLARHSDVEIVGEAGNGREAFFAISEHQPRLMFLDVQMPGVDGFELLRAVPLPQLPLTIFVTAYDQYALRAFEANAIDYLLKPIDRDQLERAIKKLGRLRPVIKSDWQQNPELPSLLQELTASLRESQAGHPQRIASRVGERISFLALCDVTHFIAQDKLTYAVVNGHRHCVDQTITELERRLDPAKFLRIHRSALVNIDWIHEVNAWFAGKVVLSLKDNQHTQLTVARDRVRSVKDRLCI